MAKFKIKGDNPLSGEITVAGNKNAALPIIAATVLTDETCILENMPEIRDVWSMLNLLKDLGKAVEKIQSNSYKISGSIKTNKLDKEMAGSLRASILYMSGLLACMGSIEMSPPGGCIIGRRNMQSHFSVFEAFGANIVVTDIGYKTEIKEIHPANIFLPEASVTATENALILAAAVSGKSTIHNAACEPHVEDLANVLIKMGAKIQGAGTQRIEIEGIKKLKGITHRIVPDHIEAGTFAIAAACTHGDLYIKDAIPDHLMMTEYYLSRMGVQLDYNESNILHIKPSELKSDAKKIQVGLWPGFPTDLMSPIIILATQAQGVTLCHDWMFESRMFFVDKLISMGADITLCDPHRVLVNGPTKLRGQSLSSPDIRAGIALVIAGLSARGTSTIDRAELVDRGYEDIANRLKSIGADIERID
jgi:UDP-N-acetylglucosamine 1-carboxyvinyltransferase